MQLSMWILADWLKEYHPETKIENGNRILRNVRLYADGLKLSRSTVYLNQIDPHKAMCSNGRDIIILQADDLNEVFNRILDAFEYYNEWQENMTACIQEMQPLGRLMEICNSVFCAALIMADATFYMREISGSAELRQQLIDSQLVPETKLLPLPELLAINQLDFIRKSNVPAYLVTVPDRGNAAVSNLFSDGKHIGWLILLVPSDIYTQGTLDLLDAAGELTEKWFTRNSQSSLFLERADIFSEVLEEKLDQQQLTTRLQLMDWQPHDTKQLYLLQQVTAKGDPLPAIRRHIEMLNQHAYVFLYQNSIFYILNRNLTDETILEGELHSVLQKSGCCAIKSPVFTDILHLKKYVDSLLILTDYLTLHTGNILSVESSLLPYIAAILTSQSALPLAAPAVHQLDEYDVANKTQLSETLYVFLKNNCNYVATARQLYIHRSTLLYRLERIQELTAIDLECYETRLHLQITYLLKEYAPIVKP